MPSLVQILLPLPARNVPVERGGPFERLRAELTERFGGMTAYLRSPAIGLWKDSEGDPERDEIVVYEVMVDELDERWWAALRERLRTELDQEELVIRALPYQRL
jgi:hypothetical protein